jgi:hypothetical protein
MPRLARIAAERAAAAVEAAPTEAAALGVLVRLENRGLVDVCRSAKLGYHRVARLLSGAADPRPGEVEALAAALGVDE